MKKRREVDPSLSRGIKWQSICYWLEANGWRALQIDNGGWPDRSVMFARESPGGEEQVLRIGVDIQAPDFRSGINFVLSEIAAFHDILPADLCQELGGDWVHGGTIEVMCLRFNRILDRQAAMAACAAILMASAGASAGYLWRSLSGQ